MSYTNVRVNISENQKNNIKRALEHGEPVSIRLSYIYLFICLFIADTKSIV